MIKNLLKHSLISNIVEDI